MQSRLQPAVIGGVVIGVLSALPLISAGNCCCCLWVIGGGAVAAYLLQQHQATPITVGEGAIVGAMAGLIGAVVELVISIPVHLVAGPLQSRMMQRILERAAAENPDFGHMADQMQYGAARGIIGLIFVFGAYLTVGTAFATLGGMLGALFFKKDQPPVAPPPPPVPPFNPTPFNPPPVQ
jgi:hypothetical protein